jgi:3,4-dihydroxy 2-butanone 4-phosphate synthase/GTP cyclohydrolase II
LTIADIIKYRSHHGDLPQEAYVQPHRVTFSGEAQLPTEHGDLVVRGYRDERTGDELVALVAPTRQGIVPMVRVHSECLTGDAFGSLRCDCGPQLDSAIEAVVREGGAVVYITGHEGRGIGIINKIQAYALQDQGRDTVDANSELGLPVDRREYGGAAAILHDLGMTSVRLLTNNPAKVEGLRASGIEVVERVPHHVGGNPHNERYRRTKVDRMGHLEDADE